MAEGEFVAGHDRLELGPVVEGEASARCRVLERPSRATGPGGSLVMPAAAFPSSFGWWGGGAFSLVPGHLVFLLGMSREFLHVQENPGDDAGDAC